MSPHPYLRPALEKTLAEMGTKALNQAFERAMISRPTFERAIGGSILPPYGTVLRNRNGEHAMYLGRSAAFGATTPHNAMVILDDEEAYIYSCTDTRMLKDWQIVDEDAK